MKAGFFQYDVICRDRAANLSYIGSKIQNADFDLLVLPELFTSGYAFDSKEALLPFAEHLENSATVHDLTQLMQRHGGCITGTIPEWSDGKLYNTAIVVGAEGLLAAYRKIHLTDYEKRAFTAGDEIVTFDCGTAKVGLTICFDCWFAPLTSKLKTGGVEIISHSACFGGEVTPTILPIRALENQCFVISCNRTGSELFDGESELYRGESQIIDPDGKILVKAGNKEQLAIVDIDVSKVNHPDFGSLITKDFVAEHKKYSITIPETD